MRFAIETKRRRSRRSMRTAAVAGTAGATLGWVGGFFLDPARGRSRRRQAVDRTAGLVRRSLRRALRVPRGAIAWLTGKARRLRHLREAPKDLDDTTLARKVETELFRGPDVPKGQINVNAQGGLVQLRGVVPTAEMMRDLVERARAVRGVRDVESLLHLPGTPAPTHQ
jgi:hypothetical protein